MPHDMIDDYFKFYQDCVKEYGEKVCVFHQTGSFYEVYGVNNDKEKLGNAEKISEIIRCEFSNKNKSKRLEQNCSTRDNPDFCGFGIPYLAKYLTPLLENNYTVVIVDQLESPGHKGKLVKRGITAVHSPCLKSPDYETCFDTEYNLIGLFIEIIPLNSKLNGFLGTHNTLIYSVCSVNNTTNEIELTEHFIKFKNNELQTGLDEISRVLLRYHIGEMRVNLKCDMTSNLYTNIIKYLDDNFNYKCNVVDETDPKYKNYNDILFQNSYFKKIYPNVNFGMLTPIEYLNLSDKSCSVLNLMYTLDFMALHDIKYVSNLTLPKIIKDSENLVLELNTLTQLAILPSNLNMSNSKITSVFDVINFTKTAIGRRHLKHILAKPFKNPEIINLRYNLTEELEKTSLLNLIESILSQTIDFERLHRKMGLQALHPYEFVKLSHNYLKIIEIITVMLEKEDIFHLKTIIPNQSTLLQFNEYIEDYKKSFDLEKMTVINLNTNKDEIVNFFKAGIVNELDTIQQNIIDIETDMELLKTEYETLIGQPIKIGFTENDGYFFTCTKIRYQKLINELEKKGISTKNFNLRVTSNTAKFYTDIFLKKSHNLINTRELLVKKVKLNYLDKLSQYSTKYADVFIQLTKFVEILDVTQSNLKCAKHYKYCKPEIKINSDGSSSTNSFVTTTQMRHPIIETIMNDTEYVPNDINLDTNNLGILLYGLNSSGKSSLLRALGINIILAQCGLYVPCKTFTFYPFGTLISQVDLTDNLFANKSSFISEMCGLKKILNCSGDSTLVLSDELCRGTEVNSSTAIVASTILELIRTNTKFFFTTHLHDLPHVKMLKNEYKLNICHLSVLIENESIIFERYLKNGSGSTLYGLEVCSSIIQNSDFIDNAFCIRNEVIDNSTSILKTKKSRYNTNKINDSCEVCGYIPKSNSIPLDTHHIEEQKNCDKLGFVNDKHYHKNRLFNLVTLCKQCHLKIDTGELVIKGYKQTTNGPILQFTKKSPKIKV